MPEASSGSTPPRCLGNPTPKAGDLQKPGLGAQPALPSWARPGFSPAHHSSGVLSPHPSSYGIRNCSRLGSGGLPTLPGTAPPMVLCSGLGHTCSTPRSPAGPLGKSGPGNASLKELAGWGRFSGTWGGPGPGAAPGRDLLTVGSGRAAEHKLPHPLLSPPTPPCRFPPGGGLQDAGLPGRREEVTSLLCGVAGRQSSSL